MILVITREISTHLSRYSVCCPSQLSLTSNINRQVHDLAATTTIHSVRQLKQLNVSVLVACDLPLDKLTKLDALCRSAQVKLVASSVAGRAGYVFDDLLTRHAVLDVDGEECKEVSLLCTSWYLKCVWV